MDQRGKIIDTIDIFIAVDIPDPATLTARGIDRIRLHEYGGAPVAARQARQSTIVELLGTRLRIWIHALLHLRSRSGAELQYARCSGRWPFYYRIALPERHQGI